MAAEGRKSAMFYLPLGFYIGLVFFHLVAVKYLEAFLATTG
jgi:hypothetical protein